MSKRQRKALRDAIADLIGQDIEGQGLAELLRGYLEQFWESSLEPDRDTLAAIGLLVYKHQERLTERVRETESAYLAHRRPQDRQPEQ